MVTAFARRTMKSGASKFAEVAELSTTNRGTNISPESGSFAASASETGFGTSRTQRPLQS